jgi:hypothetical protein
MSSSKKNKSTDAGAAADAEAHPCISDAKYEEQWKAIQSFCETHMPMPVEKAKASLFKHLAGSHSYNEIYEKIVLCGSFSVSVCENFAFFLSAIPSVLKAGDIKEELFSKFDAGKSWKALANAASDYIEEEFWPHFGLEVDSSDEDESGKDSSEEESEDK